MQDSTNDISIPDSSFDFFESTFVGGLYNKTNVLSEQPRVLEDAMINDVRGNQYKTVTFKPVSKTGEYNFEEIYAKSYLFTNVNLLDVGGSLEHLTLIAKNTEFTKEFKADTSACDYLGQDWNYDSTTKKCLKVTYTCNSWNDEKITVNGIKYCHYKSDSKAICKGSEDAYPNYTNGFDLNKAISPTACVNLAISLGWNETLDNETLDNVKFNGKFYRLDYDTPKCKDHYQKNGYFMYETSKNGNPSGCYWSQDTSKEYKDPNCYGWNEIRVDGVCKSLVNGNIKDASCKMTSQEQNKFSDLISNYYFQNSLDKNKYIFGPLSYKVQETSIVDSDNGTTYKVCDYIEYTQEGYKNYYVYPSFDIKIDNIQSQGKHEITTSPTYKMTYREINISECNWIGENCKSVFDKSEFNDGMQQNKDVPYKYGDIFLSTKNMNYNGTTDRFEIRKNNFKNVQLLPSEFSTFDSIKNNLNSIKNSDNNKTIKLKALKFNIVNNNNSVMILDSGPIDVNKVE